MRIDAPVILVICTIVCAPSVRAQTSSVDKPPLPQFVPPAAQDRIAQNRTATAPVADATRKAAEMLSARFSGDALDVPDGADRDAAGSKAAPLPVGVSQSGSPAAPDHVVVLRARESLPAAAKRKLKSARVPRAASPGLTVAEAVDPPKYLGAKPRSRRSGGSHRTSINSEGARAGSDTATAPDAEIGWKTGLIGMLTNPAFWH